MIEISGVHKKFGSKQVLRGVDLEINEGETLAIIGRSGCGKSVLFKHIVGLLLPDEGTVKVEGKDIAKISRKELYELRKNFGFLFQGAALFDSMTVEENIALPIIESGQKVDREVLDEMIREKLAMVGLKDIQKQKPSELSGGMKKRVGLARALITNPGYILYDEPTTGLDPIMSESIDNLIKELAGKLSVTSIVVTHDMLSVEVVADRVAMVHEGRIHFTGTPQELMSSDDEIIRTFLSRTEKRI
ncbi:MAG: ABC transporter ATP-binding protein [Ignavibacteriaceae bacterium]|nr:ABC transporter ATP-binding protein [Ignavibacteriaceae bacterium]NUM71682.1 ABC transporter ATP-binding protein [Ignavibacteriaceae bacterium]